MVVSGVLLAAGRSQRMGQPKLLLPWRGVPLIRHVVQIALASRLNELIVVVGHREAHIRAALADLPVNIVRNLAFLDGQSTSLVAGLNAVNAASQAVLIMLPDQPLLRSSTIDTLIAAYENGQPLMVVPRYEGQRGNPVVFDQRMFARLRTLHGDVGARRVIQAHAGDVRWVDVADMGVLVDVDTPDMYQQLVEQNQP